MVAMARAVVCLSFWLSVCQVRSSYIPGRMNRTIQNLLQHYRIPPRERFNGKPVFSRELLSGKMEDKKVFLGGVLETYEELIGKMLKQLPTPSPQPASGNQPPASAAPPSAQNSNDSEGGADVQTDLNYILKMVQHLKKHRYQGQEKLLQELKNLKEIKMDNLVVQSKALWELPWMYEEASALYENIKRRRRRRRHARRIKTQQKA